VDLGKKPGCISKSTDVKPEGILKGQKSTGATQKLQDKIETPITINVPIRQH